jgi:hypothetical protein
METPATSSAAAPAAASAARSTSCCDGPLGAVSVLLRPSWLTAEPASSASTWPLPSSASTWPLPSSAGPSSSKAPTASART